MMHRVRLFCASRVYFSFYFFMFHSISIICRHGVHGSKYHFYTASAIFIDLIIQFSCANSWSLCVAHWSEVNREDSHLTYISLEGFDLFKPRLASLLFSSPHLNDENDWTAHCRIPPQFLTFSRRKHLHPNGLKFHLFLDIFRAIEAPPPRLPILESLSSNPNLHFFFSSLVSPRTSLIEIRTSEFLHSS